MPDVDPLVMKILADAGQLRAELQGADRVTQSFTSNTERAAARVEASIRKSSSAVGQAFAHGAQSSRMLGAQIADIGTQLASGASPFLVLAQQGNQLAMALDNPTTKLGRFASFLTGPVGAAVLAAVSFIGLFASKMTEAGEKAERKKTAIENLKEALRQYAEMNGTAAQSETVQIRLTELSTKAILDKEVATRKLIKAQLEQARAQFDIDRRRAQAPGQRGELASLTAAVSGQNVAALEAKIAEQDKKIGVAQQAARAAGAERALLNVAAATDKVAKATQEYDLRLFSLNRKLQRGAISQAEFERQALAATRRRDAAIEAANKEGRSGRKGPSAETLARRAEAARLEEVRDQIGFQRELGAAQSEYLSALGQLTADTRQVDEYVRQQIEIERQARENDYKLRGPKSMGGTGDLTEAQLKQLLDLNDKVAQARQDLVNRNEFIRYQREQLQLQQSDIGNQRDLLQANLQLADTSAKRQEIELRLLDLQLQEEKARLEAVLASKAATDVEKQIAEARLKVLPDLRTAGESSIRRSHESPGQAYIRSLSRDAAELGRDFEGVAVDGLQALNDQLADAIVNSKSLGDVFRNVAKQIVADLLRIAIQQNLIRPMAEALFGGMTGGGGFNLGGIFNPVLSLFGRASGGYVAPGQFVRVNEAGSPGRVEGFRPQGAGTIIPLGQMNAAVRPAPSVIVHAPQFNLKGAVVTEQLYADMQRISNESSKQMGAVVYQQAMRDAPAAVGRARRFGVS